MYQTGLLLHFFDSGTGKGRLAHRRVSIGADTRFCLVGHRVERERFGPKTSSWGIFSPTVRESLSIFFLQLSNVGEEEAVTSKEALVGVSCITERSRRMSAERLREGTCAFLFGCSLGLWSGGLKLGRSRRRVG